MRRSDSAANKQWTSVPFGRPSLLEPADIRGKTDREIGCPVSFPCTAALSVGGKIAFAIFMRTRPLKDSCCPAENRAKGRFSAGSVPLSLGSTEPTRPALGTEGKHRRAVAGVRTHWRCFPSVVVPLRGGGSGLPNVLDVMLDCGTERRQRRPKAVFRHRE